MNDENIIEKFKELIENNENKTERKFTQSVDMFIKFKDIDFEKQPEFKIDAVVQFPKNFVNNEIAVFADGETREKAKTVTKYTFGKNEISGMKDKKDRRIMRKVANNCEFFIAQKELMPLIGKTWGIVLGPRGKMPQIIPPNVDVIEIIERLKKSSRIRAKKGKQLQVKIGNEKMPINDLVENYKFVIEKISEKIDEHKISSIIIKTTMGKPIKVM